MKTTYEQQWREYRKRRNTLFIILATYIPGVLLFALLFQRLLRSDTATSAMAFAWMLAFAVVAVRVTTWPCPRCGKWFHAKWPNGAIGTPKSLTSYDLISSIVSSAVT